MLELRNLVCAYGKIAALKGVSLKVEQGQLVALIGANGAGKTTTLRSISGLLPAAEGQIIFEGEDVTKAAERRAQVAGTLSGGEQQMLAIGRALMSKPKLILFDEPSLGLAPNIVERTFAIIEEIRASGTTVLMVEQNAYAALEMCDYAYLLESGTLALEGSGRELIAAPHVREAYLGG